jgi:SAM-dependent methyltransferase
MAKREKILDRRYLASQYRDASNLNARIELHLRFSTNSYGLWRWIFDRFDLPPACRILELGCGPGDLWRENAGRIPEGWEIVLSDYSIGMVRRARKNLASCGRRFRFAEADAQAIPFADGTFDAVVADHMLYHVPDRAKALREIRCVLKPGGRFFAATNGRGHMRELVELAERFDPSPDARDSGGLSAMTFTLENGGAQVAAHFADVALHKYEDALLVTEEEPLVAYLLSGWMGVDAERTAALREFVRVEMERRGGTFRIAKDAGIFTAVRD